MYKKEISQVLVFIFFLHTTADIFITHSTTLLHLTHFKKYPQIFYTYIFLHIQTFYNTHKHTHGLSIA